jgi:hypothetical protein
MMQDFIMDENFSSYLYVFHTCFRHIVHLCLNNMNLWFFFSIICTTNLQLLLFVHTHITNEKNHTNGTFRVCKFAWTPLCFFPLYSWSFHLCKLLFSFVLCFFCLLFLVLLLVCITCSLSFFCFCFVLHGAFLTLLHSCISYLLCFVQNKAPSSHSFSLAYFTFCGVTPNYVVFPYNLLHANMHKLKSILEQIQFGKDYPNWQIKLLAILLLWDICSKIFV